MWHISITLKLKGNDWNISLTANEASVLTMLRAAYSTLESQFLEVASTPSGQRPSGLLSEVLVLLRCLVFNRLEESAGRYVNLKKV